jgi:hypothetical protein
MIHFEDSFALAPFSNEQFKEWREANLFSMDVWQKLLMLVIECSNTESNSPDETVIDFMESCYHLVLSGCDVHELCTYICGQIPVEGVSKYVFLWQFAYRAVAETPLPALMGHSRNEFINKIGYEESPEANAFYEYLPIFPYEGIEGPMEADTHLFELAETEAEIFMLSLSYSQMTGDFTQLDKFIRDHGNSEEARFLKATLKADKGKPGEAIKIVDELIKSHKGPVDDLITFRASIPVSGAARQKRKKADFEPVFDSDYESDYESDHIVPIPVKRESPKIYPNDPCPCGSGKKYKKCCGKNKT